MRLLHNTIKNSARLLGTKVAVLLLLASWMGSCSNEVEVIGVWKDIPVVYGIFNWQDSAHYLRIERAYLPPNQSALEVAKNIDSLYFDPNEVNVNLYVILGGNDTIPWPWPIERVNLADEGIDRDAGIFQDDPSYAYKTTGVTSADILLEIEHLKTGNTFYARTESVRNTNASLFLTPRYAFPQRLIELRQNNPLGQQVYAPLTVDVSGGYASIYDYMYRFHYDEYEVDNQGVEIPGTRRDTFVEWRAVSDFIPETSVQNKQSVTSDGFYRFLGRKLSDVTGTRLRRCGSFLEVYAVGGSSSIRNYIQARKANDGFVGGLFPAPPYSNIQGGYGVLGTADVLERVDRPNAPRLMKMSDLSYEHLNDGEPTKNLGFSPTPCF